jgi:polyphosphate glucokinase
MEILGIDIGGSGIKGAPVDVKTGELLYPRHRIPTPQPSKPKKVAKVVAEIADHFDWHGAIGCGYPGVIQNGHTWTAANVDDRWIGLDATSLLSEATGCPVRMINDADAAGLAEMSFGVGRGREGVVLIVTIGTGLGTALFTDGVLVPNSELGHIEVNGVDVETRASDAARKRDDLSITQWAKKRFDPYLNAIEFLIHPDLIILGGGISKKAEKILPYMTVKAEVVIAQLLNDAGIVGAALAARQVSQSA